MTITGKNTIAGVLEAAGSSSFVAINPTTGKPLVGTFFHATMTEVERACQAADEAFLVYRFVSAKDRAAFLRAIGQNIMALGDDLITRTMQETGFPEARVKGERGRTVGQLNLFADLIEKGVYLDARIDKAQPDRQPAPKPDIRSMKVAMGPVVVFGASNFPLAFSTAGGDTASALAAGCPVIVKAHTAHPGCGELVASAITKAIKDCKLPAGVFSMVFATRDAGQALVCHPAIKAVGFTGSKFAGTTLCKLAASRPEPIPVYAEMGSSNPVFVLPKAIAKRSKAIAEGLTGSVTLGAGQFCTNPGMTVVIDSEASRSFLLETAGLLKACPAGTTVQAPIKSGYDSEVEAKVKTQGVEILGQSQGTTENPATAVKPVLLSTTSKVYRAHQHLSAEIFGPSTMAVTCTNKNDLFQFARELEGHLTASIFGEEEDFAEYCELFSILREKAGRVIVNQYPTGVEVCPSMVHGGPFPSSSDTRATSVGTMAIDRFIRPVAFQNFPQNMLPVELQDANPLAIWRTVDGTLTK